MGGEGRTGEDGWRRVEEERSGQDRGGRVKERSLDGRGIREERTEGDKMRE